MISFKYFFWSALFGGVIGGVLGAMLTLNIFSDQRQEQAEGREALHPAADMRLPRREPVEHDYIPDIWIEMGEFLFLFFFYYFFYFWLIPGISSSWVVVWEWSPVILKNQVHRADFVYEYKYSE